MKLVLEELQETLELPRFPARIESFDVSNIQGAENVAGMVVCENGKMNRSEYRKFRIRSVEGSNDVASMREAVFRRYRRVLDEGKPLPDLIMIDGGKGQLGAAAAAMRELNLEAVPWSASSNLLFVTTKCHICWSMAARMNPSTSTRIL